MDYTEYTGSGTVIDQRMVNISDGVALKIIEFIPKKNDKKKPIVIFVAGWISHISGWKEVLREITGTYHTIYLESREKKSSLAPRTGNITYDIERLKLDLKEVVDAVIPRSREFVFVGSSLGATVIMEYCTMQYRDPLGSILISPLSEFRFPKLFAILLPGIPVSSYSVIKPLVKWYLKTFRVKEEEQSRKYNYTLDEADPYKLKKNAMALKNYKIWDSLKNITVPCLIIGAADDTLHSTDEVRQFLSIIPRAEYEELASNKETHSVKAGQIMVKKIQNL